MVKISLNLFKLSGSNEGFFKIGVTQVFFKEAGAANIAIDLLIMSAVIGAIVPGSLISRVVTGSQPHDVKVVTTSHGGL